MNYKGCSYSEFSMLYDEYAFITWVKLDCFIKWYQKGALPSSMKNVTGARKIKKQEKINLGFCMQYRWLR